MSSVNRTTVRYLVDGMHCPNCGKKIKSALEELTGVEEAVVDRENGQVEVTFEPSTAKEESIRERINTIHGGKFFAALADNP